jgi:hypothetical protein
LAAVRGANIAQGAVDGEDFDATRDEQGQGATAHGFQIVGMGGDDDEALYFGKCFDTFIFLCHSV